MSELQFPLSLGSDNHAGVHPLILESLAAVNFGHAHAYGMDEVSELANLEFKRVFGAKVEAHYVFTGTAANVLALASGIQSFEAVICSDVAHLQLDECGAPEHFLGTKLYTLPSNNGKIRPEQADEYLSRRGDQHFAQPRFVSLTQPNELGVCYTLAELKAWREWCDQNKMYLHIDGARLANACIHLQCDMQTLVRDADCVSFGGTKNGLLGAEAVLLFNDQLKHNFKFKRKQAMQLPSKSRFMAAQFLTYLKKDLFKEIARHTVSSAQKLKVAIEDEFPELKIAFPVESNALFVQIPEAWIQPLKQKFFFYIWEPKTRMARWMISQSWNEQEANQVLSAIREVKNARR